MISDLFLLRDLPQRDFYHGWVAPTKLRSTGCITMLAPESANLRVRVANSKPEYFELKIISAASGTLVIGSVNPGACAATTSACRLTLVRIAVKVTRIVSFAEILCSK